MLGTTDSNIDGSREVIRSLHGGQFSDINAVSYCTSDVVDIPYIYELMSAISDSSGMLLFNAA